MKILAPRITAVTLAIAMSIAPAQAGFLDDFYDQSGATTTMTPAGVYQGQSSNVVSGGALSMRVPGMAEQLILTKGRSFRGLKRWRALATSSFPVPFSP